MRSTFVRLPSVGSSFLMAGEIAGRFNPWLEADIILGEPIGASLLISKKTACSVSRTIYNEQSGHAETTTKMPGQRNV